MGSVLSPLVGGAVSPEISLLEPDYAPKQYFTDSQDPAEIVKKEKIANLHRVSLLRKHDPMLFLCNFFSGVFCFYSAVMIARNFAASPIFGSSAFSASSTVSIVSDVAAIAFGLMGGLLNCYFGGKELYEGAASLRKQGVQRELISCCKELRQPLKAINHLTTSKGEALSTVRLFMSGVFDSSVGLGMIAIPITSYITRTLWFDQNPWFLGLLFLMPALIMMTEFGPVMNQILHGKTLAQYLRLDHVRSGQELKEWKEKIDQLGITEFYIKQRAEEIRNYVKALQDQNARESIAQVSDEMLKECERCCSVINTLDENVGIGATLPMYTLYQKVYEILKRDPHALDDLMELDEFNTDKVEAQKKLNLWFRVLGLRIGLEVNFILAFVVSVSMSGYASDDPKKAFRAQSITAIVSQLLMGLNYCFFVPLDLFAWNLRNTRTPVPDVRFRDVAVKLLSSSEIRTDPESLITRWIRWLKSYTIITNQYSEI